MKRKFAKALYDALELWFEYACEYTGHWHGCALLNQRVSPTQWAWRTFGHWGEFGTRPWRRKR